MRLKKLLISGLVVVGISVPAITMLAIGSNPRNPTASSSYLMKFDPKTQKEEYNYIQNLKSEVAQVFDEYKKINPNFQGLQLEYINLKSALTPGEINFFSELNKSLMGINPNLTFKLTQRNPLTLQQGFYQQNVDMVSFYWSPDYNDIGTWLTYMFSTYQTPNLWPTLSSKINSNSNEPWVVSLRDYLKNISFEIGPNKINVVDANNHAITYEEIFSKAAKYKESLANQNDYHWSIKDANTSIGNGISDWANNNSYMAPSVKLNPNATKPNGFYKSFDGGYEVNTYKPSFTIDLINYLTSFNTNLPYIQDGADTINNTLIRTGAHIPTNPNSNPNYRDYYYEENSFKNKPFRQRIQLDPFESTISPFNPSFTKSSTTTFNTIYTPLFSWSTTGDYYSKKEPNGSINVDSSNFKVALTSYGTSISVDQFQAAFDKLFNQSGELLDQNNAYVELPIRAIPWVNYQGKDTYNNKKYYLSPQDFLAGFIGYGQSVKDKFNTNDYFINLINLDLKKTIEDPVNQARNESLNDKKPFRIYFKKKELNGKVLADVLTSQYFNALPAFNDKVQNIIDPVKYNKIAKKTDKGVLDISGTDMTQFYGNGNGKKPEVWQNLWFASPYYLSNVNDTKYVFTKNKSFFDFFEQDLRNNLVPNEADYNSYKNTYNIKSKPVHKFDSFEITYGKDYKQQINYEEFKVNQTDTSPIPSALKAEVFNSNLQNYVYYSPVIKLNKSDLIPYNLQVYQTEKDGSYIFPNVDNNSQIMEKLTSDKYGNIIFPNNISPVQKDKITPGYTDLIVKNFYTPINGTDASGKLLPILDRSSAIIRTAINDCINWMSINSLISSDITRSFQNSFFPFGVAKMSNSTDVDSRWDYWNIAAYKVGQKDVKVGEKLGGLIEWTLPQLLESWQKQFEGK